MIQESLSDCVLSEDAEDLCYLQPWRSVLFAEPENRIRSRNPLSVCVSIAVSGESCQDPILAFWYFQAFLQPGADYRLAQVFSSLQKQEYESSCTCDPVGKQLFCSAGLLVASDSHIFFVGFGGLQTQPAETHAHGGQRRRH